MSVPPSPVVIPPSPPVIDWKHLVLAVLAALMAGYMTPKPGPAPDKGSNVVPDKKDKPTPPSPAVAVITVNDLSNTAILGGVEPDSMFVVKVVDGYSVIANVLPPTTSGQVFTVSDTELVCSLQETGKLQVIAYGVGKPTTLMIQANQAPQPPPVPVPVPVPSPQPAPSPSPSPSPTPVSNALLTLCIVEDPNLRTVEQINTLNVRAVWDGFIAKGHLVRTYSIRDTTPEGKAATAAAGSSIPGLVIVPQPATIGPDGKFTNVLYNGLFPSAAAVTTLVSKYGR